MGQAHRQGQPMEVEVRVVVTPAAVLEGAEHDAAPGLYMDSAVEEGAAVLGAAVEGHGQGIMQRRTGKRPLDRVRSLLPLERNGGSVRIGRAIVGERNGVFLADKVRRGECDAPAGSGEPPRIRPGAR